jgi:hypothetical protein
MSKKAGALQDDPPPSLPPAVTITEENIDRIEGEALSMVNRTISALEEAITAYESASPKPAALKEKYLSYVKMDGSLKDWTKRFLLSRNSNRTFKQRLESLEELIAICQMFARGDADVR